MDIHPNRSRGNVFLLHVLIVLVVACGIRLYRLGDLPLGAFVDEIFMVNSSLILAETPVDPFGHTLAVGAAWGKDHPNLFLYFNLLVLKLFAVSDWSTKLLSVIPGVAASVFLFLIAQRLFDRRVAVSVS